MTLKTFKYTHGNTCSVKEPPPEPKKPTPKTKGRPKKEIVAKNLPQIQEEEEEEVEENKEVHVFTPEPRQSFETIRNERRRERVQQRTPRISNLFLQAF